MSSLSTLKHTAGLARSRTARQAEATIARPFFSLEPWLTISTPRPRPIDATTGDGVRPCSPNRLGVFYWRGRCVFVVEALFLPAGDHANR